MKLFIFLPGLEPGKTKFNRELFSITKYYSIFVMKMPFLIKKSMWFTDKNFSNAVSRDLFHGDLCKVYKDYVFCFSANYVISLWRRSEWTRSFQLYAHVMVEAQMIALHKTAGEFA